MGTRIVYEIADPDGLVLVRMMSDNSHPREDPEEVFRLLVREAIDPNPLGKRLLGMTYYAQDPTGRHRKLDEMFTLVDRPYDDHEAVLRAVPRRPGPGYEVVRIEREDEGSSDLDQRREDAADWALTLHEFDPFTLVEANQSRAWNHLTEDAWELPVGLANADEAVQARFTVQFRPGRATVASATWDKTRVEEEPG